MLRFVTMLTPKFSLSPGWKTLTLRTKVEILKELCDYRLDAIDVPELLRGYPGDQLRIDPVGFDDEGMSYWYFYGTRLYKAAPNLLKEKEESNCIDDETDGSGNDDADDGAEAVAASPRKKSNRADDVIPKRKILPAKRPQVKREEAHEVEEDFDLGKELEWLNEVIDEEEEYEEEEEENEEEEEEDKDGGEWTPTGGRNRGGRRGKGEV